MMKVLSRLLCLVLCLPLLVMGQEKIIWNKDGKEMVLIPAGSFEMGDHHDNMKDALPVHTVTLDGFYMDIHEVTVGEFKNFVNLSGYDYRGDWNEVAKYSPRDKFPMVYVNWNDANAYAVWAGKRLPTEAEWEYSARGGLTGKRFPWGDEIKIGDANWGGRSNGSNDDGYYCSSVGRFEANGYGLYDMAGNVMEWCLDGYEADYYSKSEEINPLARESSPRVMRGGAWYGGTYDYQRVASRFWAFSVNAVNARGHGFRCVSGFNVNDGSFSTLPLLDRQVLSVVDTTVSQVRMESKPNKLPTNIDSIAKVRIALYNPEGNLVKGESVSLVTDKGDIETPAKDNGDGTYTAIYTAGKVPGEVKITAVAESGKFAISTITLVDTKVELNVKQVVLLASTDASTELVITVKDATGRPLPDQLLQLSTNIGTVTPPIENEDGIFIARYIATDAVGKATINAYINNVLFNRIAINLLPVVSPNLSEIRLGNHSIVKIAEPVSVIVTLKTEKGFPIPEREVSLQVKPADNLKLISTAVTNQAGNAIFKFTSSQPGVRLISATVDSTELDGSVAVIFTGEAVEAIPITEGTNPDRIWWGKDGSEMVLVSSGNNRYYVDIFEVTVAQYQQFMRETGYTPHRIGKEGWSEENYWSEVAKYSPTGNHPMIYVGWNDANEYAKWVGKELPDAYHWLKAAWGWYTQIIHPWDAIGKAYVWGRGGSGTDYANYSSNNSGTTPVGSYRPNGFGIFDLAGNVWEWGEEGSAYGGGWRSSGQSLNLVPRTSSLKSTRSKLSIPDSSQHSGSETLGFRCMAGIDNDGRPIKLSQSTDNETTKVESAGITESIDTPSAVKLELKAEKSVLPASPAANTKIVVTVLDSNKKKLNNETVYIAADKGEIQSIATNNGDGTYTAVYTAGNVTGEAKINAVTTNGKFAISTITLLNTKVTLQAQETTLPPNPSPSTFLTIDVKDSEGNPVKGETVKLKADKGFIHPPIDNGDGTFTAKYTGSNVVGDDQITVITSAGKQAKITLTLLSHVVSASKSSIELGGSANIKTGEIASVLVTLKTEKGILITNRPVALNVDPADNLRMIPTVETDREGKASFKFTSSQPGIRMITVSSGEVKLDASIAVIFSGDAVDALPFMGITWEKDGAEMAYIPAGSFEMGDHHDNISNALPVHTVTLDGFYMDVHEVTVGQFREFVNQSGYSYNRWNDVAVYSPGDEYPMVHVNWNDATAYAKWAGKRLPTEAEWEYAARGGLAGKRYPWGDEGATVERANYDSKVGKPAVVSSYPANGYGLYDMAGNVWEWCQDWYGEDYYQNSAAKNPPGPDIGSYRVLRGGPWYLNTAYLRVALRDRSHPDNGHPYYGFRCGCPYHSESCCGGQPPAGGQYCCPKTRPATPGIGRCPTLADS